MISSNQHIEDRGTSFLLVVHLGILTPINMYLFQIILMICNITSIDNDVIQKHLLFNCNLFLILLDPSSIFRNNVTEAIALIIQNYKSSKIHWNMIFFLEYPTPIVQH